MSDADKATLSASTPWPAERSTSIVYAERLARNPISDQEVTTVINDDRIQGGVDMLAVDLEQECPLWAWTARGDG
ncbi:MAG: hypothetical protein ACRDRS_15200 [Pseudonocardiaceae bacterium]